MPHGIIIGELLDLNGYTVGRPALLFCYAFSMKDPRAHGTICGTNEAAVSQFDLRLREVQKVINLDRTAILALMRCLIVTIV